MTREELIETARRTDFHEEVGLIDEINELFDDIETRTCENCKYYKLPEDSLFEHRDCIANIGHAVVVSFPSPTFGCNKFEREQD